MANKLMRRISTPAAMLRERDNMFDPFDKVFDTMFKTTFPDFFQAFGIDTLEENGYPKVNVLSYDDKVIVEAEIAGMDKDNISVDVHRENGEQYLTISGKTSTQSEQKDAVYLHRELKRSAFNRSFRIGKQLDGNNIDAQFVNGLLTITIPKLTKEIESTNVKIK